MTRFSLSLKQSFNLVDWAIRNSIGGEIIIPKIPSYRILDLAKAVNPKAKLNLTGLRPGEKIHEEMISDHDSLNTIELNDKYIICPNFSDDPKIFNKKKLMKYYIKKYNAKKVPFEFNYNSETNKKFLSVNNLKRIILDIKNNNS